MLHLTGTDAQCAWLQNGITELERRRFFIAHEQFEEGMRVSDGAVRLLFHGLAQLSASYYQLSLGRGRAAVRTWKKAREKLAAAGVLSASLETAVDHLHARLGLTSEGPRFFEIPECAALDHIAVPEREMLRAFAATRDVDCASGRLVGQTAPRHPGSLNMTQPSDEPTSAPPAGLHPNPEPTGLLKLLGLRMLTITESEVTAELPVHPSHHQPMGIVHGGVYCSIVETVCSIGAYVHSSKRGLLVVGVDNQTSFLKATRSGTLRAVGRPLSIGRTTHLWEANIYNEQDVLVSTGRVRLLCVQPEANLGGQASASGDKR
jgi:1,4-dihydroxy-2-naphthoyl-CoA hydrolase